MAELELYTPQHFSLLWTEHWLQMRGDPLTVYQGRAYSTEAYEG